MCYWNKYIRSSWRSFCPRPTNIVRLSVQSEFLILSIRLKAQTSQGNQTVKLKLNKLHSQNKARRILKSYAANRKIVMFNSSIQSDNLQNKFRPVKFDQSFWQKHLSTRSIKSFGTLETSRFHAPYKFNFDAQQVISARFHTLLNFKECLSESKSIVIESVWRHGAILIFIS